MSWSCNATGSKDKVTAEMGRQLDQAASNYGGTPEADDIKAAKARELDLVDALVLQVDGSEVVASAYGSHSRSDAGLLGASFTVNVSQKAPG